MSAMSAFVRLPFSRRRELASDYRTAIPVSQRCWARACAGQVQRRHLTGKSQYLPKLASRVREVQWHVPGATTVSSE